MRAEYGADEVGSNPFPGCLKTLLMTGAQAEKAEQNKTNAELILMNYWLVS